MSRIPHAQPAEDGRERAVVLLSGGLDSATVLALARQKGLDCVCLTLEYGQRHSPEIEAARWVADHLGASEHRILEFPFSTLASSALTEPQEPVPVDRDADECDKDIPPTYVPARNTIFLSCALAVAESTRAQHIYCGVNAVDFSGYPDCRPEYIEAFQRVAELATQQAVEEKPPEIHAPLINLTKARIILKGIELGVDYSRTVTCYDPDPEGRACGRCDACILRRKGFDEAGVEDPTRYQDRGK
ncbi:MAG: 7-cyano-7-deazaguanine synthase QueC [Candidatus Brocadiia bacterium]